MDMETLNIFFLGFAVGGLAGVIISAIIFYIGMSSGGDDDGE